MNEIFGTPSTSTTNLAITAIEISETGKIICRVGYDQDGIPSLYEAAIVHHAGMISIPPKPDGKKFCNAVVNVCNGQAQIVATDDDRSRSVIKTLQPGESAVYSIDGSSIVRVKSDKIDVEFNDGNKITISSSGVNISGNVSINGGEPLVKRSEFNALVNWILAHKHAGVTAGSAVSGPYDAISQPNPPQPSIGTLKLTAQ